MILPRDLLAGIRPAARFYNPEPATLFRRLAGGRAEIGFEQGPQFRGDFGLFAEPERKAAHRLMQQHAKPVGGAQAARFGRVRISGVTSGT